jgi:dihydrolipoamide dehydrogenase
MSERTEESLMSPQAQRVVDVAVIGAGTAGLAAYRSALAITPSVLLLEGGARGTTCARVGCMPSKLLLAAAESAHDVGRAALFGVRATAQVDGRAVMDRVRGERDRFVGMVVAGMDRMPAEHRSEAYARFLEPGVLGVGTATVRARAIVVAAGSSPVIPPMFAELGDRVVVNDDVFAWDDLPDSVAVFGAGVIGLEVGQALHRLGVRVRIFGKGSRLGPLTDPVVRRAALVALGAELPIELDAAVQAVRRVDDRVEIDWQDHEGSRRTESFAYALVAAGRRPNLAGLDVEKGGVSLDARGLVTVDRATTQLGQSNVFFAGDVNHDIPLLHEAADDGRIAGENAARFPDVRRGERRSRLVIVFCDPEMAAAGESFTAIESRLADVAIGEVSFVDQGRSRIMGKNYGAARVYADRNTGRFLGAEMAGPQAEHIGHLLAWSHQQRLTIGQMLGMPFYHPVVEEGIRTALRDASAKLASPEPVD